jgi:hypothetical protein
MILYTRHRQRNRSPTTAGGQTSVDRHPSGALVDRRRKTSIEQAAEAIENLKRRHAGAATKKAKENIDVLRRRYTNVVNVMEMFAQQHGTGIIDKETLRLAWGQLNRSNGSRPAEHHFAANLGMDSNT